jgi:hypothetical protein
MTEVYKTGEQDDFGFPVLAKRGVSADGISPEHLCFADASDEAAFPAGDFGQAKFALEAASGGRNTLILDDVGLPSVMVRIPMFKWSDVITGGEDAPCSAFVVGDRTLDCIYISKYLNVISRGRAYSLPGRDPAHTLTIDEARSACAAKGAGWHLLTNAEWCAVAHLSQKNGTAPRGNNNFGSDFFMPHEHGVLAPNQRRDAGLLSEYRTLTGSGPDAWTHDRTPFGIHDLNGNIWDWIAGLRVVDGEIQIIPNNDSAAGADESETGAHWRAISLSGEPCMPHSTGSFKYDGVNPGIATDENVNIPGGFSLSDTVRNCHYTGTTGAKHRAYGMAPFREIKPIVGITPHMRLIQLGLYPASSELGADNFFLRNYGERMAARGGSWFDGAASGLWDLYLRETREFIYPDIGFRAAYIPAAKTL